MSSHDVFETVLSRLAFCQEVGGAWYTPADEDEIEALRSLADDGEVEIKFSDGGIFMARLVSEPTCRYCGRTQSECDSKPEGLHYGQPVWCPGSAYSHFDMFESDDGPLNEPGDYYSDAAADRAEDAWRGGRF